MPQLQCKFINFQVEYLILRVFWEGSRFYSPKNDLTVFFAITFQFCKLDSLLLNNNFFFCVNNFHRKKVKFGTVKK